MLKIAAGVNTAVLFPLSFFDRQIAGIFFGKMQAAAFAGCRVRLSNRGAVLRGEMK